MVLLDVLCTTLASRFKKLYIVVLLYSVEFININYDLHNYFVKICYYEHAQWPIERPVSSMAWQTEMPSQSFFTKVYRLVAMDHVYAIIQKSFSAFLFGIP